MLMPRILNTFGYRRVLLANTVAIGIVTMLFVTVSHGVSPWLIVALAFILGFGSSMQFTSMNTLVIADLPDAEASSGSSISSTVQQMSMSFGVAVSSLLAGLYLGGDHRPGPEGMISGIHWTLLTLGFMTIAASFIFRLLRPGDGASVSQHTD